MFIRLFSLLLALLLPCAALAETLTAIPAPQEGMSPISFSQDGSVGLYSDEGRLVIVRADGSSTPVAASKTRGAADTYGNLAKIVSQGVRAIGSEGLVWSPDGRYAAIVNQLRVVQMAQMIYDPIVIDMQTGEMFLLASYDNNKRRNNSATVLTAAFSADSRYLYAVVWGNMNDAPFSLIRCDLTGSAAEVLLSWEGQTFWPHLAQLRDGSFLLLKDTQQLNNYTGLAHITPAGKDYALTVTDFTQRMIFFYPRSMQYSAQSGHALILSNTSRGSNSYSNLLLVNPDEGIVPPTEYWAVPSLKASVVSVLSKNELQTPSNVVISSMRLSPDGERALLLCNEGSRFALLMLSIDDRTLTRVTGVDSDTLASLYTSNGAYIDWRGDIILLGKTAATAVAHRLK